MTKLKKLLEVLPEKEIYGDIDCNINKLEYDSRKIEKDDLFFAMSGFEQDGHKYINSAIQKGAVACVLEKKGDYPLKAQIKVKDSREALSLISALYYDYTSSKLKVVGVTGTNGKTTITYMLKSIWEKDAEKTGLIGTIAYHIGDKKIPAANTTPESLDLQRMFYEMLKQKVTSVAMEVSSHSLVLNRVKMVDFDVAVFTNLNPEHLDFHKDMKSYREAKGILFQNLKDDSYAVINLDDPEWEYFYNVSKGVRLTYSLKNKEADFYVKTCSQTDSGFKLELVTPGGDLDINLKVLGDVNIYNALAAVASAFVTGTSLSKIKTGLESFSGVPGRLEQIESGQNFKVIIDYAHTPFAFENLLLTVRKMTKGKIVFLFGCGGDRDRTKREIMGRISSNLADFVMLTTDNPRSEDPKEIIAEILKGVSDRSKVEVILDRKEAIISALRRAKENDTIVLAGKGHEDYQIIGKEKLHFSEREIVEDELKKSGRVQSCSKPL
ncbi:MAG: UDP-N-acetylmuramoyl-L-alanyl-D-glutamate--2,6-diaminopimelate ligase [candidate division Zixibacteria bacterium]|nr:UDP-N-acetylmuramoyl-L-alanyl-D-glutamate--2,6-diaminopimelate ligase [candidate division Zixibacteria bacterium]